MTPFFSPQSALPTDAATIYPVPGVDVYHAMAHIRKPNRRDIVCLKLAASSVVSGVFTQNLYAAAPVKIAQEHLAVSQGKIQGLVINTGNANAATGDTGLAHARLMSQTMAEHMHVDAHQVLPFSTGVIMEPLPIDRVMQGIHTAMQAPTSTWQDAALGIMTTDTRPKLDSRKIILSNGSDIYITGIAKGAGMIRPNMATMLGFITTNATLAYADLCQLNREIADASFNCITIDGDTSTNDAFVLAATGQQSYTLAPNSLDYQIVRQALLETAQNLAKKIVLDGEGATKFINIYIKGAPQKQDAQKIAYAIAHSPLVKTAFFASDPNLGRILAAVGYSSANIDIQKLNLYISGVYVVKNGSLNPDYQEAIAARAMQNQNIEICIDLQQGDASVHIWTCDFSHEYVSINADYRS